MKLLSWILKRNMSSPSVQGVTLQSVVDFLEKFAPSCLSEQWDNTGLLLEPQTPRTISTVLLTNDLTELVVREAIDLQAQLIISYHPPIFRPMKRITTDTWKERIVGSCLENKIAVYSPHTSWDSVQGGVNDWLISPFDIISSSPIIPHKTVANAGAGRLATLKEKMSIQEVCCEVEKLIGTPSVRVCLATGATLDTKIQTVAVCAGSGASVFRNVQADLYITGEMSHHELLDAVHADTSVVLCDHSNSERGFLQQVFERLKSSLEVEVLLSVQDADPVTMIYSK